MEENENFSISECPDCSGDCPTVYDFLNLTDELLKTIIDLDEELVRWRQALIKYLPLE